MDEFFDDWRTLEEFERFSEALCDLHPLRAKYIPDIGSSAEGRPIHAVEIGGRTDGPAVRVPTWKNLCSPAAQLTFI